MTVDRVPAVGVRLELSLLAAPLATLASSVLLARALGPDGRGVVVTYMLWAQLLAWLVSFSADKGFIQASRGLSSEARAEVWRSTEWILRRLIAAGVLIAVAFAAYEFNDRRLWLLFVTSTVMSLVFEFAAASLLAAGRWAPYTNVRALQPILYSASVVVACTLPGASTAELLLLVAAAHIVSVGVVVFAALRLSRVPVGRRGRGDHTGEILHLGVRYQLTSMANQLANRGDVLTLSLVATNVTVGLYSVATAPSAIIGTLASAAALRALTQTGQRWRLYATWLAGASIAVAATAPLLIPTVFGEDFRAAVFPAVIITISAALAYPTQHLAVRLATERSTLSSSSGFGLQLMAIVIAVLVSPTALAAAIGLAVGRILCLAFLGYASQRPVRDAALVRSRYLTDTGLTDMAITIDATSIRPGESAGVESFCFGLLDGWAAAGAEIRVFVNSTELSRWEQAVVPSDQRDWIPRKASSLASSRLARPLKRALASGIAPPLARVAMRSLRSRVAHVRGEQTVFYPFHRVPTVASRSVVTVHDLRTFQESFRSPADQLIISRNVARSGAVVTSWPHPYEQVVEQFPEARKKTFMVALPPFSRPPAGWTAPSRIGPPLLLFPASTGEHKNHAMLLRAVAELPDVRLVCPGPLIAPGAQLIADLCRTLGIGDRVAFPGFVSRAELDDMYARADVVVTPTLWEAASGPVYEALAWGVPVAASNIAPLLSQGLPFGDAVEFFDPSDIVSIRDAISAVLADRPRRAQLAWAAGTDVRAREWCDTAASYGRIIAWVQGKASRPDDLVPRAEARA